MSGNTPLLMDSENARAPWNEPSGKKVGKNVLVTQTLQKESSIHVFDDIDYNAEEEWKRQHYGILELLNTLHNYVVRDIALNGRSKVLERIKEDCELWTIETEVTETS